MQDSAFVDYNKQCGVINDKNLPCSRSLACKDHSMTAKLAVRWKRFNPLLQVDVLQVDVRQVDVRQYVTQCAKIRRIHSMRPATPPNSTFV